MIPDVLPEERSRIRLVPIAALAAVLVAVSVTAVVVLVGAGTASGPKADISHLTPDMLLDKADVPSLTGGSWVRQVRDVHGPSGPDPLKVTPPECASPMNKGARQIGSAQWTTGGKDSYGLTLGVPTTSDHASLSRWVDSCSAFGLAGVTTGSVRPLALSGVPDWAVAYTLTIGVSPHALNNAGIIGVYRGVVINAFYSFGATPDPTLRDGLPKIFNAEVAKLDAV
jgi:hypothetical protein